MSPCLWTSVSGVPYYICMSMYAVLRNTLDLRLFTLTRDVGQLRVIQYSQTHLERRNEALCALLAR